VIELLIAHDCFAEHSFREVSRYRVSAVEIMNLEILYVLVPEWESAVKDDFAVL
jgi:hypothetical protein